MDTSFTHLYDLPGAYTVLLKAENPASGCPVSYDTAVVHATILKADFMLPDTICGGEPQLLDARNCLGANATCYKGYTWFFSFNRPIRTDQDTLEFLFGPSGLQTVSLEVEDINGCKDTLDREIFIYNRFPEIGVSDAKICVPGTVMFTDLSTADAAIVSWEWDFGDGNTSTDPNPTHTFTTAPPNGQAFEVTLRIEDAFGCPGFASAVVNVYKPVSNILTLPSPPNICAGSSIAFAATDFTSEGSSLSWQWNFGNGQTGAGQSTTAIYTTSGQFTTKLVFTEIATGCKDSVFTIVNVQDFPQANFASNVDGQNIICYPQNMLLTSTSTANSPLTIFWNLGNGITSSGNQASTVFPKGTYTVSMIASTPFGCRDTVERSFTVVGPEGAFEMDKNLICVGDAITFTLKDTVSISSWEWNFGDGTTGGSVNPVTHVYNFRPPSNATVAKLVLKGEDDACSITVELPVNFSPVRANFTAALPACAGASVLFTNTSTQADQSSWTFGDGGSSQLLNPVHIFNAQGNYTVKLVVTDLPLGCKDSTTQVISITGIPGLQLFGDTICPGDTAVIGLLAPSLPNATFIWSPAGLVLPPNNDDIVRVRPAQTTNFTLQVIDASGCQDTASTIVFVPGAYMGAQNLDTIVAKDEPVLLPVTFSPGYIFEWMPADPSDPPVVQSDTSVTYTLIVSDVWGCTDAEFEFNIQIVPEKVFAPNAFTPDGDGNNDVFTLLADGDEELVRVLTLRVYSRWGELVYEGTGLLNTTGWNGEHNGKASPSDVYAWLAEVEFLTGKKVMLKGDLTLLR
ncbi:MAG: PKD domain-containing protein [Lewinellaceae bacterium]|nr:PKD domain-containing protein [Lewinellaceae bacterium]